MPAKYSHPLMSLSPILNVTCHKGKVNLLKGESRNSQDQAEEDTETPLTSNGHMMQPTEGSFQQL